MFRVRLRSGAGEARARMYVHAAGANLEARSGVPATGEARRATRDRLRIELGQDYRWDDTTFHDADEMAAVLLKHMSSRLEAVRGAGPAA
jgi:hypothetical protein